MIQHKQEFPTLPSPQAPDYLSEELKKIDGYKNYNCGNRVIEYNEEGKGRPVLGEDGKPITVPRYIIVNGTDDMDKAEVKVTIDKYIADYPAYAEAKQAEYDAQDYSRDRVQGVSGSYAASQGTGSIYPSTGEQLDMLYHELETSGSLTISGSWFNTVKAVKDENPKP